MSIDSAQAKKPPSVFVSYSHDSEDHKSWVHHLAEDLTNNGVKTTLDQWNFQVGDDIGEFMEKSLATATYVVLVCTEPFARKANDREGGVGYEQAVLVGELLTNRSLGSRFLPILDLETHLPRCRATCAASFIDCRDNSRYEEALDQLLRRVFGAPALTPPELGEPPDFGSAVGASALKAWILVAGSGSRRPWWKLDEKLELVSNTLGASLARSGYGIVTGGWPGVDAATARSFANELRQIKVPLEDRLTQVIREDWRPKFLAGNLVLVPPGEKEWTESVKLAEAVILVGGHGGTWTTGDTR